MKYSNELKTGAIVLAGILLLIWGINYLKGKNFFSSQRKFYAVYHQVDGLSPTNQIHLNGVKIGRVAGVEFLPDNSGNIVVTLAIDNPIKINKNSVAKIVSTDLMGTKSVQIILSNETAVAQSGDTLLSATQLSLTEEVNKQVAPIKQKAENLLASMDSVLSVLQYVFNKDTRDNLSQTFENIAKAVTALQHASFRLDTLVTTQQGRLVNIFANVESIALNLRNNNDAISSILKNTAAISDTIAKSNFSSTINNVNKSLQDFSIAMEKVTKGHGSLGLLLNNDSLYNNLSSTAGSLDSLIKDINANPKKYVHFSMFGGKNKPAKKNGNDKK